jgi:hypothetical protein
VRQCGGQPGQDEAVRRHDEQGQRDHGRAGRARLSEQRREDEDRGGADQVADEQHPLAAPAVEEHAGERPDDGVRQQQRGEGPGRLRGDVARSGLKKTLESRAAWNSPSANWPSIRTESSRRKSGADRTSRRPRAPVLTPAA